MNYNQYFKKQNINFSGKTVAITGSTGAIGSATALFIAQNNGNLILLDRNEQKSQVLREKIYQHYPQSFTQTFETDFSSLQSIAKSANKLKSCKLDLLILNAGVFNLPHKKGVLGLDKVFEINFLIPFLYVSIILPTLKANHTKVVIVGSIAYKKAKFNKLDVDYSNEKNNIKVYGNSKRFLMFTLAKLFERENIKYSICHPGIVQTSLTTHYHKSINWLVKGLMKCIFHSPKKASLTTLYAICHNCKNGQWVSPHIFNIWGKPKIKPFSLVNDEALKMLDWIETFLKQNKNTI